MNSKGSASMVMKRGNSQKPKDMKYTLKRLWDYMYKFKWLIILAFILTISSNAFALIGPKLLGYAINAMQMEAADGTKYVDFDAVFYYATLMAIFYVLSSILAFILSRLMIYIGKRVVYKMREDAFNKLMALPVSYFDTNLLGDIISKMSYDIDTINTSLSSDIIHIANSIITVTVSFIMMLTISPLLVLVFVFTIPLSLLFTRLMLKKTKPLFRKRSSDLGMLNAYVEEMITGANTIKVYSREDEILNIFDEYNTTSTESSYKAEYYGSITGPGVNFINNLSLALISIFGAILNIYQGFKLGDLGSFVGYSRKFSGPINEIANIFVDIQTSLAAGERVFGLIDAKAEDPDKVDAIEVDAVGDVEFKDVYFGYRKEHTIIKDLSFTANSGKVVAIVGPTGAGKTTIVNLLMRFYDIDEGMITLDDNDIYNIKRSSLRKNYAMVLQDTWLFEASVYDNLSYGNDKATLDEVIKACKEVKIHDFIMHLPNGYDTILTEGGTNISKGQKQLLTIARAMLLDSKILILDEATSNIDTRTEEKISEAVKKLMKGKTCFMIAHRLSTIKNADLILVVRDGNIVEQGTHDILLNNNGFYSELYYSQFD